MPTYTATFITTISLYVTIDATDEDEAADTAWDKATDYLNTLGNHHDIRADADLDGIAAEEITPTNP